MTTDRQELAVQVAERIWKWKFERIPGSTSYWWIDDKDDYNRFMWDSGSKLSIIESEVFSWAGFGRTVEAIAKKYKEDEIEFNTVYLAGTYTQLIMGLIKVDEFWLRTHLKALEALKEKK